MSSLKAIRTLGALTRGHFDVWALAGDHNARTRAALMAELLGVPKVPQSKAGITAIRLEFYRQLGIAGDTPNGREERFLEVCRAAVA